ncbi:TonB-dependent receptor plug [Flammeovirgaceae bacterium 311]|nr:TonB-dependent receptor plug [Flammeovirgaceae bacterium 311]
MNKILLTIIILLSSIQLVSAQIDHLDDKKKGTTIRLYCGNKISSSLPSPLFVLHYKQQEYIIDTAELKSVNPDDMINLEVLKGVASVERYGDKGKYGVILIEVRKSAIERFLHKEELD